MELEEKGMPWREKGSVLLASNCTATFSAIVGSRGSSNVNNDLFQSAVLLKLTQMQ